MCIVAHSEKVVRQSISLPSSIARRVKTLANRERTSANRVIVNLIETGLQAREREKRAFFELAERLANSSNRVTDVRGSGGASPQAVVIQAIWRSSAT